MERTERVIRAAAELGLETGRRFGAAEVAGVEAQGGAIRVLLSCAGRPFWADLFPRRPGRRAFARTASFDVLCPPMTAEEERLLRPALEALVEAVGRADSGRRSGLFQEQKQEGGAARARLEEILAALPSAECAPARLFRAAVHDLLASGLAAPEAVEPSLAFGEDSFRALVNVMGRDHDPAALEKTAASMMKVLALELPRLKAAALSWLGRREHDLHFGLACGSGRARAKLYFSAAREGPVSEYADLLRDLEAPAAAALERAPAAAAGFALVGVDVESSEVSAFKMYWRIDAGDVPGPFLTGKLWWLLESAGAKNCPLILCRRFNARGLLLDESLHAGLCAPGWDAAALAREYARLCGAAEAERRLEALSRMGVEIFRTVLSETGGRGDGRHVYLTGLSQVSGREPQGNRRAG